MEVCGRLLRMTLNHLHRDFYMLGSESESRITILKPVVPWSIKPLVLYAFIGIGGRLRNSL